MSFSSKQRVTSTLKIAHKKRGLDSLPLAFYVGVSCTEKFERQVIIDG